MFEYGADTLLAEGMRKSNLKFEDVNLLNGLVDKQHLSVKETLNRFLHIIHW